MNKTLPITIIVILLVIIGAIIVIINFDGVEPFEPLNTSGSTEQGIQSIVDANNQFAIDLYSKLNEEEGNLFYSPYSISSALAMTYEGAKGQTADEMKNVFYFPEDSILRPNFASLYNEINEPNENYQLSTANALWAEQTYDFLDSYFNLIDQYYGGGVTNMDFKNNAEQARQIINTWVEDNTNGKIKDIIAPGILNSLTRLVLTNAIYFKGQWEIEFDVDKTRQSNFYTGTETIQTDMMNQYSEDYNYSETDDLQIIELNYKGDELSMLILLPKDNIENLESSLTLENHESWKQEMYETEIGHLSIPKFKFETKYYMASTLSDMGMPTAFSNIADFSGMSGYPDLKISQVIHQTFVEVNEEGTEAAAATVVTMETTAVMPSQIDFIANHPFIFIIQQKDTGNILFLGKMVDPSS